MSLRSGPAGEWPCFDPADPLPALEAPPGNRPAHLIRNCDPKIHDGSAHSFCPPIVQAGVYASLLRTEKHWRQPILKNPEKVSQRSAVRSEALPGLSRSRMERKRQESHSGRTNSGMLRLAAQGRRTAKASSDPGRRRAAHKSDTSPAEKVFAPAELLNTELKSAAIRLLPSYGCWSPLLPS